MKRHQKIEEKGPSPRLSTNGFPCHVATHLDIVDIIGVEDLDVVFEAIADIGMNNCLIKKTLQCL